MPRAVGLLDDGLNKRSLSCGVSHTVMSELLFQLFLQRVVLLHNLRVSSENITKQQVIRPFQTPILVDVEMLRTCSP